ncbi:DUF1330 domain-containing protein [Sedimentitalea sp. CY04]|uniref:DUF1330 domain-containing protein n=1 Tax=Parasedimentitalea denitrificans TaxID=2211118 RepID=A0ABX0WF55_9RHOB|nr:DUF1330 domain-containing protein [Sedimentitalea sp. CY04]NIZ63424.1 DUF1330 domain-containing protein [Sedimentitalea sp. CY04]
MVYAYANIIVTAPESLAAYKEKAADALSKHGGRVVQATPNQTVLEGSRGETGLGAILEFATADAAKAWINDPDLSDVHALRRGAGSSTITLMA